MMMLPTIAKAIYPRSANLLLSRPRRRLQVVRSNNPNSDIKTWNLRIPLELRTMMDLMMPTSIWKKALLLLPPTLPELTVRHRTTLVDQQSENLVLRMTNISWPIQSCMGCAEAYVWSYLKCQPSNSRPLGSTSAAPDDCKLNVSAF